MIPLPAVTADDPAAAGRAIAASPMDAVQIDRPPLADLPYRNLVTALLALPGFKLDFNAMTPDAALAMIADHLLGGGFAAERAAFAAEIDRLAALAAALVGGARPSVTIRTLFAPGDLVWHVDRVGEASAFRLLWPIGRPTGMQLTPRSNIDQPVFAAFMRREHPLLGRLDSHVVRHGGDLTQLWAHRPAQVAAMTTGTFPFLRDPAAVAQVAPGAASIHRVETPARPGSFHRSTWANRAAPGLQLVMTAAA